MTVGDVINRDPEALGGWFVVAEVSTLFNGETQFADGSANLTVTGFDNDIVGVQLLDEVAVDPETGLVAPPEPPLVLAAPPAAPPDGVGPPPTGPGDPSAVAAAPPDGVGPPPTGSGDPSGVAAAPPDGVGPPPTALGDTAGVDDAPPEPAKPVAAAPDDSPPVLLGEIVPDFSAGPEVDLARVADALASLDVGSVAPSARFEFEPGIPAAVAVATTSPDPAATDATQAPAEGSRRATDPESASWVRRSPDLPRVPMPEGAVPVYGDTLPESPSYLNPVVVREPDAAPLPKRRSGG